MEVIKKYTAIQLKPKRVDDEVKVKLTYGEIIGPHYSLEYPQQEFDSEEEAIEYAFKKDKYASWMIVPLIRFNY